MGPNRDQIIYSRAMVVNYNSQRIEWEPRRTKFFQAVYHCTMGMVRVRPQMLLCQKPTTCLVLFASGPKHNWDMSQTIFKKKFHGLGSYYLEKSRRDEVPSVFLSPAEKNGFPFVL